jgi:hypothetical protein
METKRKIQFGAAAVVANALLALSAMSPSPAFANPCAAKPLCLPGCLNQQGLLSVCQSVANPGCTVTSATCSGGTCGPADFGIATCYYN